MAEMIPRYVIVNHSDCPSRNMIAEHCDYTRTYHYMMGLGDKSLRRFKMKPLWPTAVELFGFEITEGTYETKFKRLIPVGLSAATYADGKLRTWQDRRFGWEVNSEFVLPRIITFLGGK